MKMTGDEIYRARKEFFNKNAKTWRDMWYVDEATGRYDKYDRDFERLFSIVELKAGEHVLDAGCGTGVLVPFILERITGEGLLYELDYADKMIEINESLHREDNIRFIVADVENAPLDSGSCDTVMCFSCFPHLHDKEKAMAELSRILKPEGVLAVSHFTSSDGVARCHEAHHAVMHDRLPDKAGMHSLFERTGFDILVFMDEPDFYCVIARKRSEGSIS